MFRPSFCPNPGCRHHTHPEEGFFRLHGFYEPKCRPHRVPRFRCLGCGVTFSRRTCRDDDRDHRPHLNAKLRKLQAEGVGLRACSRALKLSLGCTLSKVRKHEMGMTEPPEPLPSA